MGSRKKSDIEKEKIGRGSSFEECVECGKVCGADLCKTCQRKGCERPPYPNSMIDYLKAEKVAWSEGKPDGKK